MSLQWSADTVQDNQLPKISAALQIVKAIVDPADQVLAVNSHLAAKMSFSACKGFGCFACFTGKPRLLLLLLCGTPPSSTPLLAS